MTQHDIPPAQNPWPGDVDAPSFPPNPAHARKEIPEEVLADAQNLFENSDLPVSEIARRVGLHRSLLHRTVLRKGWARPDPRAVRTTVAKRVRARVEKELNAVELSLAQVRSGAARSAARESADTLSSLMRTLRELQRYDREEAAAVDPSDDGPGQDIDALRAALADRLERMRRGPDEGAGTAAEG